MNFCPDCGGRGHVGGGDGPRCTRCGGTGYVGGEYTGGINAPGAEPAHKPSWPGVPPSPDTEWVRCARCHGTGTLGQPCARCAGTGSVIDPVSHLVTPCPRCGGGALRRGAHEPCPDCDGHGGMEAWLWKQRAAARQSAP